MFLGSEWEDKILRTEWWQAFHKCDTLIISSCTLFLFASVAQKYAFEISKVFKEYATYFMLSFCHLLQKYFQNV